MVVGGRDWVRERDEERLTGGNVADDVVRVGRTVRKPATPATAGVRAFLDHLATAGFDGAPRHHGLDEDDRQVIEFVPGRLLHEGEPLGLDGLRRVGALIRSLHDASEGFVPPADADWQVAIPADHDDLIVHHDLAPWNLVIDDERDRWVFIDWDGAGPGSRLWDLAYAAHGFVVMSPTSDAVTDGPRLRALVDSYGLDDAGRQALPRLIVDHVRAMYDLLERGARTGEQPWARLHAEGHANHWGPAADRIERDLPALVAAIV
jgi:Ser/Thr protein kinase RdoA (MazF antagonist)